MTAIAAQLDEMGKPAWIGLMILSFILFWPAGVALLVFLIGSGRMACWKNERRMHRYEEKMDRLRTRMARWSGGGFGQNFGGGFARSAGPSSGNRAFDEYKAETLRRLEEEQQEFLDFLDRLRFAKDKAEFDDFLAQRRNRPSAPEAGPIDVTPA